MKGNNKIFWSVTFATKTCISSLLALFLLVSIDSRASEESIARRLYETYGDIQTSQGKFDRAKQRRVVAQWIANYASESHPFTAFELLVLTNTKINPQEYKRFGCKPRLFGKHKCEAHGDGHTALLMLNDNKFVIDAELCTGLPADLEKMVSSLSPTMTDFMIDLMVLGYGEQTRLFEYRRQQERVCATYSL